MQSQIQAHKIELKSLTDFQNNMHLVENSEEKLTSKFHREYRKTTWYSSTSMPLESIASGRDDDDEIIYKINPTFHFLMYTYLKTSTPTIIVKPKYKDIIRICFTHNFGTNITLFASFKEDDLEYQSWDNIWADDYFQWYMLSGAGKRRNHKIGIGNIPFLEEWTSDILPSCPINVDQPWFYGEEPAHAYQIYTRTSQNRAEHRYTFRRKISDLLRMQKYDISLSKWIDIDTETNMSTYLEYNKILKIPKPVLWGRYAYITDAELKLYQHAPEMKNREYYIKDVEICDSENENNYGHKAEISLKCHNPCLAIFWKAENMDATKFNNYSNYTCNTDDLYLGWDPISTTSLKYYSKTKLNNMESDHFNIAESRKHFPSAPCENGYHAYSFAWQSNNFDGEVGISLDNVDAKLICKFADNDIYKLSYNQNNTDCTEDTINDEGQNKKYGPNFITRVRLLYIKKLTVNRNDIGEFKHTII